MPDDLASRLEMLLVLRWLDQGANAHDPVRLALDEVATELSLGEEREVLLELMRALGTLEGRAAISVSWVAEPSAARTAEVHLSQELRTDARRLFGRG
jgi:hypothetical protein